MRRGRTSDDQQNKPILRLRILRQLPKGDYEWSFGQLSRERASQLGIDLPNRRSDSIDTDDVLELSNVELIIEVLDPKYVDSKVPTQGIPRTFNRALRKAAGELVYVESVDEIQRIIKKHLKTQDDYESNELKVLRETVVEAVSIFLNKAAPEDGDEKNCILPWECSHTDRTKVFNALQSHKCDLCGKTISKGTRHTYTVYGSGAKDKYTRAHTECMRAKKKEFCRRCITESLTTRAMIRVAAQKKQDEFIGEMGYEDDE